VEANPCENHANITNLKSNTNSQGLLNIFMGAVDEKFFAIPMFGFYIMSSNYWLGWSNK
jgi:hypothetical protein